MMPRAVDAIERVLARVQALDLSAGSVVAQQLSSDIAWKPTVPCGHSLFTWTGKSTHTQPSVLAHSGDAAPKPSNDAPQPSKNAPQSSAPSSSAHSESLVDKFSQLEFRVGKIVEVKRHPDADSLYVEQIDVGEGKPREIISGLVQHIPEDKMLNASVIVFANLKPNKLRGIMSYGMLMCASSDDRSRCEFVLPPANAVPGDLVTLEGVEYPEKFEQVNPKKKGNVWTDCAPFIKTDANFVATFQGRSLICGKKGVCKASSLSNSTIS
uniref:tRNA-binding domain-containing protein n=1 Tax=Spongospora subterranea TaxID=70186 RepID=A0A0H5R857_9EUKA|eukprot:CRZ10313.1 hypothetical protein [Spongospora subterranea]